MRRRELGLSIEDMAAALGFQRGSEYRDVENYDEEIWAVLNLREIRRLCARLDIDGNSLFGLECLFCAPDGLESAWFAPRHELVRLRRESLGLSVNALSQRTIYLPNGIEAMEREPDYLEAEPLEDIFALAKALELPPQMLLRFSCAQCGYAMDAHPSDG